MGESSHSDGTLTIVVTMDIVLLLLVLAVTFIVVLLSLRQYFRFLLRKQTQLCCRTKKAIQQRKSSLPRTSACLCGERFRRKSSVVFRFRRISSVATIPEAVEEPVAPEETRETGSSGSALPELDRTALSRTDSGNLSRKSSDSTSELSEEGTFSRCLSLEQEFFPQLQGSAAGRSFYRRGSQKFFLEHLPPRMKRRSSSPVTQDYLRSIQRSLLTRRQSLQGAGTFAPESPTHRCYLIRRTSEPSQVTRFDDNAKKDDCDEYKDWSDRRLLQNGIVK